MVSCEYIIVMVCAVNKSSLIQEEEEEEEEFLSSVYIPLTFYCLINFDIIMLLVITGLSP